MVVLEEIWSSVLECEIMSNLWPQVKGVEQFRNKELRGGSIGIYWDTGLLNGIPDAGLSKSATGTSDRKYPIENSCEWLVVHLYSKDNKPVMSVIGMYFPRGMSLARAFDNKNANPCGLKLKETIERCADRSPAVVLVGDINMNLNPADPKDKCTGNRLVQKLLHQGIKRSRINGGKLDRTNYFHLGKPTIIDLALVVSKDYQPKIGCIVSQPMKIHKNSLGHRMLTVKLKIDMYLLQDDVKKPRINMLRNKETQEEAKEIMRIECRRLGLIESESMNEFQVKMNRAAIKGFGAKRNQPARQYKFKYWNRPLGKCKSRLRAIQRRIEVLLKHPIKNQKKLWESKLQLIDKRNHRVKLIKQAEIDEMKRVPEDPKLHISEQLQDHFNTVRSARFVAKMVDKFNPEQHLEFWGEKMSSDKSVPIEYIEKREETIQRMRDVLGEYLKNAKEHRPFTDEEGIAAIRQLKLNTAADRNGNCYEMLLILFTKGDTYLQIPDTPAPELTKLLGLLDGIITDPEQNMPSVWKVAMTSLLPKKPNDELRIGDYRPITILDIFARYLEQLVKNRERVWSDTYHDEQPFNEFQGAFRSKRGTEEQLWLLLMMIQICMTLGLYMVIIALDFVKAYDSVPVELAILAMLRKNYNPVLAKFILEWFSDHERWLKIPGVREGIAVRRGLPQGSKLSPTIFNAFVDSLFDSISAVSEGCGFTWNGIEYNSIAFADDFCPISIGPVFEEVVMDAQAKLDAAQHWAQQNGMMYNAEKLEVACLTHKKRFSLYLEGYEITPSDDFTFKNLGVFFQSGESMPSCRPKRLDKVEPLMRRLSSQMMPGKGVSSQSRKVVMWQMIVGVLLYGSTISYLHEDCYSLFEQLARQVLMVNDQVPLSKCLKFLGWPTLTQQIAERMTGFSKRLLNSISPVIRNMAHVIHSDANSQWNSFRKEFSMFKLANKKEKHPVLKTTTRYAHILFMFSLDCFDSDIQRCLICNRHGDSGAELLNECKNKQIRQIVEGFQTHNGVSLIRLINMADIPKIPNETWVIACYTLRNLLNLRLLY